MLSKFSQIRQSITDEIEQAVNSHTAPDVAVIEQNAQVMKTKTPSVEEVVNDLGDPDSKEPSNPDNVEGNDNKENSSENTDPPKPDAESDVSVKLAKFAKYEQKYPQLLRAYKLEKKKTDIVQRYEKVLAEYTPCKSLTDTNEFISFIRGLKSQITTLTRENEGLKQEVQTTNQKLDKQTKLFKDLKAESDKSSRDSKLKIDQLTQQNSKLQTDLQTVKKDTSQTTKHNALVGDLEATIQSMKTQITTIEDARDTAIQAQRKVQTQMNEMSTQISELEAERDLLKQQSGNANPISRQSSSQSISVLPTRKPSSATFDLKLKELETENRKLSDDLATTEARLSKESETYTSQIKTLKIQLQKSLEELKSRNLTSKPLEQNKRPKTEDDNSLNLPHSTSTSSLDQYDSSEVIGSERANSMLREAHADNLSRIKRLQKTQRTLNEDIDRLRRENMVLKKRNTPSIQAHQGPEGEKQQAYLKNVLLSYLEHKNQRHILLPVLSALLDLDTTETEILNHLA